MSSKARAFFASLVVVIAACGGSPSAAPAAPSSGASTTSPPSRALADWPEYHRDAERTGQGPATPALDNPARAWSVGVDGEVYASPLIVSGHAIVATENNTVYALDLATGAVVWRTHLGAPVSAATLPCGDIGPVTGITGTPAADPLSDALYVVAFLSGYHHVLFTLSLSTGAVTRRQSVDPGGSSAVVQQERGALALGSGYVYVPFGGLFGDCGSYHGYVVGVPVAGGSPVAVYRTPSARESGIWSSMGATISDSGTVYVVTGNGSDSSSFDYSNSVLQLSPDLKLQGYFAPSNWRYLDATDSDLGSVGVTLLPASGVLLAVGKQGVAYVLRTSGLGGVGKPEAARGVCSGAWGGTSWLDSTVFLPCRDGLTAVSASPASMAVTWRARQVHTGSPIVAAGAVWAIDESSATLYALDPSSGAIVYSLGLGSAEHFSTPAATQGYIVAPAGSAVVAVAVAP
ncbi:MAG TPA: PQQ-binding-like beta-propeller repeat protein [Candidatus Dormibacteraeota bacterium]|nr:PQQ-binding-like beta-propeller repeat protein [Candidatus Dormibacteraeota bacterium]